MQILRYFTVYMKTLQPFNKKKDYNILVIKGNLSKNNPIYNKDLQNWKKQKKEPKQNLDSFDNL